MGGLESFPGKRQNLPRRSKTVERQSVDGPSLGPALGARAIISRHIYQPRADVWRREKPVRCVKNDQGAWRATRRADATLTHLCAQVHVLTSVEAECRARWCVEGEQVALAHIARSQNGWDELQRWGDVRAPVGTWEGVTTNAQGRVTKIDLRLKNLRGARIVLNQYNKTEAKIEFAECSLRRHRHHPAVDR